jgi:ribonuclease HII
MPDDSHERALGNRVAGVDEAGRGPLAGPVFAAAVILPQAAARRLGHLIDDSKALRPEARHAAFTALRADPTVEIGIGAASVTEILDLNILHATMLAMRRAVHRLPAIPCHALIDGNRAPAPLPCPATCLTGGDARSLAIAAASIVAKVVRDRAMLRLSRRYPHYAWHQNAGYGTASHRAAILTHGITSHHRTGFGIVRALRSNAVRA